MFKNIETIFCNEFVDNLNNLIKYNPRAYRNTLYSDKCKHLLSEILELPGETFNEKLYFLLFNETAPLCSYCHENKVKLKDNQINKGWNIFCCKSCKTSNDNIKRKQYFINYPDKLQKFRINYNISWKNNEKNKLVVINQQQKREQNNLIKYGVCNVFEIKSVQEKCHKNNIKSGHSYKNFISPLTNNMYRVRGYEEKAILILEQLEKNFIADDFKTPTIEYKLNNKNKKYYPDIFLPEENLIIEVKSTYWLNKQYEKNLTIQKHVLSQGYDFQFWVFDNKDNLQIINII